MNERIKQLAEQAKTESNQWLGSKPAITITHDELEKFAQLIVKDCISYCIAVENESLENKEHKAASAAALIKVSIKYHFGVE